MADRPTRLLLDMSLSDLMVEACRLLMLLPPLLLVKLLVSVATVLPELLAAVVLGLSEAMPLTTEFTSTYASAC